MTGWEEYSISRGVWFKREAVVRVILTYCTSVDRRRTGKKIAAYCRKSLGISIRDVDIRGVVNWYDSKGELPVIASSSKGYWATFDPRHIQSTIDHNGHRIMGMYRKIDGLKLALKASYRRIHENFSRNGYTTAQEAGSGPEEKLETRQTDLLG